MTKPYLGYKAQFIFERIEAVAVETQGLLYRVVTATYAGDSDEVSRLMEVIQANVLFISRVATLARSGNLTEAEDLNSAREIARRKGST